MGRSARLGVHYCFLRRKCLCKEVVSLSALSLVTFCSPVHDFVERSPNLFKKTCLYQKLLFPVPQFCQTKGKPAGKLAKKACL